MTRTVDRRPITQSMQLALWNHYGVVKCSVCGADCYGPGHGVLLRRFEWDHHLALVDGGAHDLENIRPVCLACHSMKSAREHKENAKAKRLAAAREAFKRGEKKASRMKSRGFDKARTRKFSGKVVPRNPATAET